MKPVKLKRSFFNRPTIDVAVDLLGKIFIYMDGSKKIGGRLVEVEAYIGKDDPACHACHGKTPRNEIMFGKPGYLYVYFTYGNHHMLNIVTEKEGFPAAVLLRGLEPLYGIKQMMKNRGVDKLTDATNGPGKIAKAQGITVKQKGLDVTGDKIYVVDDMTQPGEIWCSPRIGIGDRGADKMWRFFIKDNPYVSKAPPYIDKMSRRFCRKTH
ncbi:MAG: 3-methyladenine DNA glycosylase [candidate division Zixibacteria bacterium 4484_95]|nr:MAG: 3-methyladenine DNA glycosylase [candidate division Zixibacteria bacterium 4484_95]RKX19300.1 MAG: DNA-3-methyladenine glycosylase [candidate division Zixibacteria bacterium]